MSFQLKTICVCEGAREGGEYVALMIVICDCFVMAVNCIWTKRWNHFSMWSTRFVTQDLTFSLFSRYLAFFFLPFFTLCRMFVCVCVLCVGSNALLLALLSMECYMSRAYAWGLGSNAFNGKNHPPPSNVSGIIKASVYRWKLCSRTKSGETDCSFPVWNGECVYVWAADFGPF